MTMTTAPRTLSRQFDPIAMELFSNRLLSITEDMGTTLIRSSFSTNIKERKDCSVAIFDAAGRLIAQAAHIPMHLGSLSGSIRAVLDTHRLETMRPGDAFICNDAYLAGGTHAPDLTIVTPIFIGDTVRFFTVNIGHHSDVGGSVPGSTSHNARTVFEEGIRVPVTRIVRAGELDEGLLDLIAHNTREPDDRRLDIKVQIATNEKGGLFLQELVQQLGLDKVLQAIDDILAYTAERLRRRIIDLKNASGTFTCFLDDDGLGGDPVPVVAHVTARGDQLFIDFAGTGPMSRGSLNVPRSALEAAVYYAIKTMLDPELLPNEGMFEPVTITAPEGSIVNPIFPAAVSSRANTAQKVAGAVIGAFAGILPQEKAMASGNDTMPVMVFSGPAVVRKGTFVYLETIGGGSGARTQADGMDGVHVHITNTSNLPAEALETEYPLLVEEYGLVADSGGAGQHRGGMGIARQVRALRDGIIAHARTDGFKRGADGLNGGLSGGTSRVVRNKGQATETALPARSTNILLNAGDSLRLETPGGGGYGDPALRSPQDIAADLVAEKVTRAAAERDYGAAKVKEALAVAEKIAAHNAATRNENKYQTPSENTPVA